MTGKSNRVYRGGGTARDPQYARVAHRVNNPPDLRSFVLGIRLVEVIDDPEPASDPTPASDAVESIRVFRGGSWHFDPRSARVAVRYDFTPDYLCGGLGFRLVEVVDE